jgi:hypothetical protein
VSSSQVEFEAKILPLARRLELRFGAIKCQIESGLEV